MMDKNKDNTFDVPAADVQDKITTLMGLPPEEAAPQLDKITPPQRVATPSTPTNNQQTIENIEPNTVADTSLKQSDLETDDAAVDDIIANEKHSAMKNSEDQRPAADYTLINKTDNNKATSKHKVLRRSVKIIGLLLIIALILMLSIPTSRYAVLNFIGMRASLSVSVVDNATGRPIKNVTVRVANSSAQTDLDGVARLDSLPLGKTDIIVQKRSFQEMSIPTTIGWGSNPFKTPVELVATGTTYTITATDWLSGLPLKNVEISSEDSMAITNDIGEAKLTIEPTETDTEIITKIPGYRTEKIIIPTDTKTVQEVRLVPMQKDIFISKRNGTYDVYTRYIDGLEETAILPGTGSEQIDTHVLANPTLPIAALVSSRAGERSAVGAMQSDVYIINTDTKQVEKVANTRSDQIRFVGWHESTLVFVTSTLPRQTANGITPSVERLVAYNTTNQSIKELATSEYIQNTQLSNGSVYFVNSNGKNDLSAGLIKVSVASADRQILLAKQIWAVYQQNFDSLQVNTEGNEWYDVVVSSGKATKIAGAPPVLQKKQFAISPSGATVAWVEDRDGKTNLLTAGSNNENQKEILKQQGIIAPLHWLGEGVLLYTVVTPQETAHYVVSTVNGISKKVGDVSVSPYSASGQ